MKEITIVGRLGANPEMRYTPGGDAVTNLRVAANNRVKEGDDWVEHTDWFGVSVWGKQAEACNQYLESGQQVTVTGEFWTREYEDKDGNDRYSLEVRAHRVIFPAREQEEESPSKPAPRKRSTRK